MNNSNYDKLIKLGLSTMAKEYIKIDNIPGVSDWTFDERLALLLDSEDDERTNRRIIKRIKEARLADPSANIEDIIFYEDRNLDKELIHKLATNSYIKAPTNIFVCGATGSGKTWLVCALANRACQENYKVKYIRMPDLTSELLLARKINNNDRAVSKYTKADLLIIDEWLLYSINEQEREIILEIIERRYRTRSTIICSQYAVGGWSEKLGGGIVSESIMDRLTSKSIEIIIGGDVSMRSRTNK